MQMALKPGGDVSAQDRPREAEGSTDEAAGRRGHSVDQPGLQATA